MIKHLLIIFILSIFISKNANASFLLEPYAGFALSGSIEDTDTNPLKGTYSGLEFGARAGISMMGFFGGATYNMATETDYKMTESDQIRDNSRASRTDLGLFVGYEFPVMVRVWGSYYLNTKLEGKSNSGNNPKLDATETWNGNGIGLGVGFTPMPFLSFNIEYKSFTYEDEDDTSASPVNSLLAPNVTANVILVSVSLPINL
ncbi:MAG: outer membrane beta-barrel protein [Bacteriovoracaceae bacterium]|jgi:hypothetical protein|nr:outer membrane beta-barrel protein [Bacteriovoracaceae bacterium]